MQLHPHKTPLAQDVNFRALAEAFPRSGGDIKNAVLKAAQLATLEPGPDQLKRIHQRHFEQGMREVIAAGEVMAQSLFDTPGGAAPGPMADLWERMSEGQDRLEGELAVLGERIERIDDAQRKAREQAERERGELEVRQREALAAAEVARGAVLRRLVWVAGGALLLAAASLIVSLTR